MFTSLFAFFLLQRLGELVFAERNRRRALRRGGQEWGGRHYPVIVAVHSLFYVSLFLEWRYQSQGWNSLWPAWLGLLAAAQALRLWTIRSLGRCWNTRIIVVPGEKLVAQGPYRFIRHPNYLVVIIEMFTIPTLCGAYITAVIFSLANALILARRIPEEEQALVQVGGAALPPVPRFLPRLFRNRTTPA